MNQSSPAQFREQSDAIFEETKRVQSFEGMMKDKAAEMKAMAMEIL